MTHPGEATFHPPHFREPWGLRSSEDGPRISPNWVKMDKTQPAWPLTQCGSRNPERPGLWTIPRGQARGGKQVDPGALRIAVTLPPTPEMKPGVPWEPSSPPAYTLHRYLFPHRQPCYHRPYSTPSEPAGASIALADHRAESISSETWLRRCSTIALLYPMRLPLLST